MLQLQRGVAESDKTEQLNNNTTQQKAEKVAILMASWDIGNVQMVSTVITTISPHFTDEETKD